MDQATPRKRSRRKPAPKPETVTEIKEIEHPPEEKPVLQVETVKENKYAPKPKVGTPKLGRSPNYVESVGLGNLRVISANGNTNV